MGIKTKNIKFKKIENKKTCSDIKNLYIDSFPIQERVDFDKLFCGVFENFELYGLYKDEQLIGMAHFNNTINFVHLNYLAVDKKYQNQGYGTEVVEGLTKIGFEKNFIKKMVLLRGNIVLCGKACL